MLFEPIFEFFDQKLDFLGILFQILEQLSKLSKLSIGLEIAQIGLKLHKNPRILIGFGFNAIFEPDFEFFDQKSIFFGFFLGNSNQNLLPWLPLD